MAPNIEPFYSELGREIRAARIACGMSQEKLGSFLRPTLTRVSIANIEAGNQRILPHTLVNVANVLGIDVASLFPKVQVEEVSVVTAQVTAELASKLGISETKAKRMFVSASKPL
jgi:transcriptional regulator with XRE-family HTH domain